MSRICTSPSRPSAVLILFRSATMGPLELFLLYYVADDLDNGDELSPEDKQRRDRRFPRIAVRRYSQSPFLYLFHSCNDQSLLNCCGVDHPTFRNLLDMFQPEYDRHTVDEKTGLIRIKSTTAGAPREFDALGALGLVLKK